MNHCLRSFLICLAMAAAVWAQNIRGNIVGQVTDSSGSALAGATVSVLNQGTGILVNAAVDGSGNYTVPNLDAGRYTITVKKEGFRTIEVKDVELLASQTARQDVSLQVGEVRQTVEVQASAPVVRTDLQTIGSTIQQKQLSELPLSTRSIDGLIALAAGATTTGNNPRISGSNYWGGNNFTLNGVAVNDPGNGGAAYSSGVAGLGLANMPAPDSLQEFKVESGNQNAEYRAVASISMVTKAGANAFHSTSYEYLQNTVLNANQFLLNATGQPRPISKLNQFGTDLGGRIIPNRLFFYGAYRGVKQKTTGTTNLTLPSMAMRQGDFSALCRSYVAGVCAAGAGTQLYNPFSGAPFHQQSDPIEPDHAASEDTAWIPAGTERLIIGWFAKRNSELHRAEDERYRH